MTSHEKTHPDEHGDSHSAHGGGVPVPLKMIGLIVVVSAIILSFYDYGEKKEAHGNGASHGEQKDGQGNEKQGSGHGEKSQTSHTPAQH